MREDGTNSPPATMSGSLFVFWILPTLLLAAVSRYGVDTEIGTIPTQPNPKRSIPVMLDQEYVDDATVPPPSPTPGNFDRWPTSYQDIQNEISSRGRRGTKSAVKPNLKKEASPAPGRGAASDPRRNLLNEKIAELRLDYENHPNDLFRAVTLADTLRYYDIQYRDGGTLQAEGLRIYQHAVTLAQENRQALLTTGQPTDTTPSGKTNINEEIMVDYKEKSADGVLCGVATAQGKLYFMANMFEKAVDSYSLCLAVAPHYVDALNSRGASLLVLGKYEEAARDFLDVIKLDKQRLFSDAFSGLARILEAKEDAVEGGGWDPVVNILETLIPKFEEQLTARPQAKSVFATGLSRYHHTLFVYHDKKTKDYVKAWENLTKGYEYKLTTFQKFQPGSEKMKSDQAMAIFRAGFWPHGIGSQSTTPVFIIGFPRSGSTLLERVLDAHPMIVGTGENSVFNGQLDSIRNQIVEASVSGDGPDRLAQLTKSLANKVVRDMRERWEELEANTPNPDTDRNPKRFVDKMLTNYNNLGFIHMLYPNALVLHIYREPMDTLFSAYKHEFPSGTLDYTSDFVGLAELYNSYRDLIEHWDTVLPGRVTHGTCRS